MSQSNAMGGRERTQEKKEEWEEFRKDPKNRAMFVCDLQALKVGTRARGRAYTPAGTPALRSEHAGLAQEASLKCQTTISTTKPDCSAQILAYRVSRAACARARAVSRPCPAGGAAAAPAFCCVGRCRLAPRAHAHRSPRGAGEQECLKAIAAEQKKERDRKFWGTK